MYVGIESWDAQCFGKRMNLPVRLINLDRCELRSRVGSGARVPCKMSHWQVPLQQVCGEEMPWTWGVERPSLKWSSSTFNSPLSFIGKHHWRVWWFLGTAGVVSYTSELQWLFTIAAASEPCESEGTAVILHQALQLQALVLQIKPSVSSSTSSALEI